MGVPSGIDLATAVVDSSSWNPSSFDEEEITFSSSTTLTSGIEYHIVFRLPDASGAWGKWQNNWSNPYANGVAQTSSDSGSTWGDNTGNDLWFKVKSSGIVKEDGSAALTNFLIVQGSTSWRAQSFVASSTYSCTSVALRVGRSGLPGNAIISIQASLAAPTKASTPAPTNANASVTLDQATLGWVDGGGADTFNVYYGTDSGSLTLVSSAQAGMSFTVTGITDGAPYTYLSVRYWRIDSTNDTGTTTGDEWSFTTIRFTPIGVTYFYPTTGQYYRLLIQSDGTYGDVPGVGVENTDFVYLAAGYEANFVATNRRLVSAANSKIWIEDI